MNKRRIGEIEIMEGRLFTQGDYAVSAMLRELLTENAELDALVRELESKVNAAQRQQQYIAGIIESEGKYVP